MRYDYDFYKDYNDGGSCVELFFKQGNFRLHDMQFHYCIADPVYHIVSQRNQMPIEYLEYHSATGWDDDISNPKQYPSTLIDVEYSLKILQDTLASHTESICQEVLKKLIEFLTIALNQKEPVSIRYYDY